jgi:hypothetical protein
VAGATASSSRADEIRLKDGKKLYGVIVAYEDNMFKVKTDFGYVLVEKDKIASIIPDTPSGAAAIPGAKPASSTPAKSGTDAKPKAATPTKSADIPVTTTNDTAASSDSPAAPSKREKAAAIVNNANARPEIPVSSASKPDSSAPMLKTTAAVPKATLTNTAAPPPPPPKDEPPANDEVIQGNLYVNRTYGFRMFKAPSWQLIEAAGQTLPNAIVAMGTNNESTLLVVSREKTKNSLDSAATAVEKRLHDVYENYRLISNRKTMVGGLPALEYRYRGMADDHDWSGTLVVVSRGPEIFTVLGMTYADTDLIQIQENVIARAIASLDFGGATRQ